MKSNYKYGSMTKAIICLAFSTLFLFFACNQGTTNPNDKPKPQEGDSSLKELNLIKITVYDEEVKNDMVEIPLQYTTVTKDNVKMYFTDADAPKTVLCEPATLTINVGEEKSLKVYVEATSKYDKFEKTIKVNYKTYNTWW
ncbi:MAG: hypothetical protein ACTTKH_03445 [Treponema sp.]